MRTRYMMWSLFLIIGSYASWRTYNYFFDTSAPVVNLVGINEGEYYSGDVSCVLEGYDAFKVKYITIILDGTKELVRNHSVNRKHFSYGFSLPTQPLTNGKHTLAWTVDDSSYQRNKSEGSTTFFVDNVPLHVAFLSTADDMKVFQGRVLHVQFQVNKPIKEGVMHTMSQDFACYPEGSNALVYDCYVPLSTESEPSEHILTLEVFDLVGNVVTLESKFQVVAFPFKRQVLNLDQEKTRREMELGASEAQYERDMLDAMHKSQPKKIVEWIVLSSLREPWYYYRIWYASGDPV